LLTALLRPRSALVVTLVAVALGLAAPQPPAHADPDGSNASLTDKLGAAAKGYNEAKALLDTSKVKQAGLDKKTKELEKQVAALSTEVSRLAAAQYRGSTLSTTMAIIDSPTPHELLQGAATVMYLNKRDDDQLRKLAAAKSELSQQKSKVDAEVKTQQEQLVVLEQKKAEAEKALATVGGNNASGFAAGAAVAEPVPRNPNGSLPPEGCSVPDPTTSGCLSPRTLHALQQAQKNGFNRFVACFRGGTFGEHPQGKACDYAAQTSGFGGVATGGDKLYGDKLAGFFQANAQRLGVLYIIWFNQIWMASTGWRSYNGDGTPSGNHTNHVHLSEQ